MMSLGERVKKNGNPLNLPVGGGVAGMAILEKLLGLSVKYVPRYSNVQ